MTSSPKFDLSLDEVIQRDMDKPLKVKVTPGGGPSAGRVTKPRVNPRKGHHQGHHRKGQGHFHKRRRFEESTALVKAATSAAVEAVLKHQPQFQAQGHFPPQGQFQGQFQGHFPPQGQFQGHHPGVMSRIGGGQGQTGFGPRKLVVTGLAPTVSQADLVELFAEFGNLEQARLRTDQHGQSLGMADVLYRSEASAKAAMNKYNGIVFDNVRMTLTFDPANNPRPIPTAFSMDQGQLQGRIQGHQHGGGNRKKRNNWKKGQNSHVPHQNQHEPKVNKSYGDHRKVIPSEDQLDDELEEYVRVREELKRAKKEEKDKALDEDMEGLMTKICIKGEEMGGKTPTPSEESEEEEENALMIDE